MVDNDFKLDLVKLNFIVFGATISGIKVGINYYEVHVIVGLCVLGATAFMQYLSILPEFSMVWPSDDEAKIQEQIRLLDEWYIILGGSAYLFIIFAFVKPYGFPDSIVGAALPFIFTLLIFYVRLELLKQHPSKRATPLDKWVLVGLSTLLLLLTIGVVGYR